MTLNKSLTKYGQNWLFLFLKKAKKISVGSTTSYLNVAKPTHLVETTELSKGVCGIALHHETSLIYSALIQSHLLDENICCTKVFCAKKDNF